jgi:hypothetical protein
MSQRRLRCDDAPGHTESVSPHETAAKGGRWLSRNLLVLSGVSPAALGKVLVAVAVVWPVVLAGRVVDRIGKGERGAPPGRAARRRRAGRGSGPPSALRRARSHGRRWGNLHAIAAGQS